MADTTWVLNDKDRALYGTAAGLGADTFSLSSRISAQAFVNAKVSITVPHAVSSTVSTWGIIPMQDHFPTTREGEVPSKETSNFPAVVASAEVALLSGRPATDETETESHMKDKDISLRPSHNQLHGSSSSSSSSKRRLSKSELKRTWACPSCSLLNQYRNRNCSLCGFKRDFELPPAEGNSAPLSSPNLPSDSVDKASAPSSTSTSTSTKPTVDVKRPEQSKSNKAPVSQSKQVTFSESSSSSSSSSSKQRSSTGDKAKQPAALPDKKGPSLNDLYKLLSVSTTKFGEVLQVLRSMNPPWTDLPYKPDSSRHLESNQAASSRIYLRPTKKVSDRNMVFNEDYFFSEDALLHHLRACYGLLEEDEMLRTYIRKRQPGRRSSMPVVQDTKETPPSISNGGKKGPVPASTTTGEIAKPVERPTSRPDSSNQKGPQQSKPVNEVAPSSASAANRPAAGASSSSSSNGSSSNNSGSSGSSSSSSGGDGSARPVQAPSDKNRNNGESVSNPTATTTAVSPIEKKPQPNPRSIDSEGESVPEISKPASGQKKRQHDSDEESMPGAVKPANTGGGKRPYYMTQAASPTGAPDNASSVPATKTKTKTVIAPVAAQMESSSSSASIAAIANLPKHDLIIAMQQPPAKSNSTTASSSSAVALPSSKQLEMLIREGLPITGKSTQKKGGPTFLVAPKKRVTELEDLLNSI